MTGGAKYYVIFEGVQGMRRHPAGFARESPLLHLEGRLRGALDGFHGAF